MSDCLAKTFFSLVADKSYSGQPELRVFAPLSAIYTVGNQDLYAYLRADNSYKKVLTAAFKAGKIPGYEISIEGQTIIEKGRPTYQLHWLASMGRLQQDSRLANLAGLPLASAG